MGENIIKCQRQLRLSYKAKINNTMNVIQRNLWKLMEMAD